MTYQVIHGDCLEVLRGMADNSVDAIVTDPPYGLSFMGKRWDYDVPSEAIWRECLRVLKPGGHLLAFAGTRTQHRMAVRIEDAGFEIRDMIAWLYGSGFPKSLDVSKALDKAAGVEREVTREGQTKAPEDAGKFDSAPSAARERRDNPATAAARQWSGWGTALKPALEPITVARKPLIGTVAENVLAHGTGALNIDGCRIEGAPPSVPQPDLKAARKAITGFDSAQRNGEMSHATGRWPANVIHDGSEEVLVWFPQTGLSRGTRGANTSLTSYGFSDGSGQPIGYGDTGSAARFYYCAKASKRDRDEGLDGFDLKPSYMVENGSKTAGREGVRYDRTTMNRNNHPTVKPTDLMRYLCRLVTPPGGTVLDPFTGSGSTGKAAVLEGFSFIGIEREAEYVEIARARIAHVSANDGQPNLFGVTA